MLQYSTLFFLCVWNCPAWHFTKGLIIFSKRMKMKHDPFVNKAIAHKLPCFFLYYFSFIISTNTTLPIQCYFYVWMIDLSMFSSAYWFYRYKQRVVKNEGYILYGTLYICVCCTHTSNKQFFAVTLEYGVGMEGIYIYMCTHTGGRRKK